MITLGDNNYQSGAASTIDANIGKYYHDFIGNYHGSFGAGSATNRFWPSPGNHDWVAPNLQPYTDYFTLPGNERYYDVDLGLVHLYAMDSDEHEPDGNSATSKQALWLKDKLAASKSCYDLVYFHYPAYSSGDHGSSTGHALAVRGVGRRGGAVAATITTTSASRSVASRTSRTASARRASTSSRRARCPRRRSATTPNTGRC